MSDRIATAAARLNSRLKTAASATFTYRRGAYSVSLLVTIGGVKSGPLSLLANVMADRDLVQPGPKHVDHPFWFNAADLILNGSLVEPAEGDTIEQTVSGRTYLYQIVATQDGQRAWQYASGHETGDAARILVNGRLRSVT